MADDFSQDEHPVSEAPPFAVGFFSHPNSMAMFMSAGMMLALGQAIDSTGFRRWVNPAVIGVALIWTYSLGAYFVVGFELIAYALLRYTRSAKVTGAVVWTSLLAVVGLLALLPSSTFNPLCWRYGLWATAFNLLATSPSIFAFGSGMYPYGGLAYYFQPHNLYVYMLLEYGLPGLVLMSAILFTIVAGGFRDRHAGRWTQAPLLSAAWIAVLGFFVAGIVESVLLGIESRAIVMIFLACYLGLRDEAVERLSPTNEASALAGDGALDQPKHLPKFV